MSVKQTLFSMTPRCIACSDLGLTLGTDGSVSTCWRLRAGAEHNEASPAALMIQRAIEKLRIARVPIDPHAFAVAVTLMPYTTAMPCKRDRLVDAHFMQTGDSIRKCAAMIETLRRVWHLPVGSRKEQPTGYWIITDIDDFSRWVEAAKAAPITQLTTIHRVAKRNFPVFAEQMELEFWRDLDVAEPSPLAAAA